MILLFAVCAVLGLKQGLHYYEKMLEIQLDPTHEGYFFLENRALASRPPQRRRIVLFGDSRIERWTQPPVMSGSQVVNRGIGGDTTAQLLLRLKRDVIDLHPDVVVVQVGINDLKAIGIMPENADRITKLVKNNIRKMVSLLRQNNIRVLLMTILPAGRPDLIHRLAWSNGIDRSVATVNQYIRYLGRKTEVSVLDCTPPFARGGRMRSEYAEDTLHLNAKGYELLGQMLSRALVAMTAPTKGA
jgi:lysophospholipase L1-like esterase